MADPVVPDSPRRVRYVVTNPLGQSVFPITFPVITINDGIDVVYGIQVSQDDDVLASSDYTVSLEDMTVTLDTNAPEDAIVVLQGETPAVRLLEYALRGGPPSARLNGEFNSIYYMIQELKRQLGRKLGMAVSSAGDAPTFLDPVAGRVPVYNATTNRYEPGPNAAEITNVVEYAEQAEDARDAALVYRDQTDALAQSVADLIAGLDFPPIGGSDGLKFLRAKADLTGYELVAGLAYLAVAQTFSGAQRASVTALTSTAASIAVNLALNNDFSHTLTENTTLANPSNIVAGQSGAIRFTQHASSPKTLAFGSNWKFAGGVVPTLTATNSAIDTLFYAVRSATVIEASLQKGFA